MKTKKIFWVAVYFLSPLLPIILILAAQPFALRNGFLLASIIFGACAYTFLSMQFILSARPPFIDRVFGQDTIYRFHAVMAVVSFALGFIHRQIKVLVFDRQVLISTIALVLLGAIILFSPIFLIDSFLLKIKPIAAFKRFSARTFRLKRRTVKWVHNLTLVVGGLLLVHVLQSTGASISPAVRAVFIAYFAIGMSFYVYHQLIRRWILNREAWRVAEVVESAPNIHTLKVTPGKGGVFNYQPGQFMFLRVLSQHIESEEHPFTISSSPTQEGYITATIKASGDYTSKIGQIRPGDKALVDAPYGIFSYLRHKPRGKMIMIAGGIGITPLLSMLRYMRDKDPNHNVQLIWGVQRESELVYRSEVAELKGKLAQFDWVPVMSNQPDWPGEKGFITRQLIEKYAIKDGEDPRLMDFYVCGPPIMMDIVIPIIMEMGVPSSKIHFERFAF